jgi:hypothetical protein
MRKAPPHHVKPAKPASLEGSYGTRSDAKLDQNMHGAGMVGLPRAIAGIWVR